MRASGLWGMPTRTPSWFIVHESLHEFQPETQGHLSPYPRLELPWVGAGQTRVPGEPHLGSSFPRGT